jgi:hypothetical protein
VSEYPGLASYLRCRDLLFVRVKGRRVEFMNPGAGERRTIDLCLGHRWQGFPMPGGGYHRIGRCQPFLWTAKD